MYAGASNIWLSFQLQAFDWKESHFFKEHKIPRIFFKRSGPILTLVVASLVLGTSTIAQEADKADPVQWHHEDATPEARYQTSRKEAGAAFEEQKKECRAQSKNARQYCMKEARQQWKADLERAKSLHGSKH